MHQCNDNRDIDSSQMNYHDLTLACSDFHLQPYSLMSENPVFSTDDLVENQSPARKMQLLRLFLIGCIDSGKVKGLQWLDKEKTLFKIPSKLAGQHDYDPQEDAKIFMVGPFASPNLRISKEQDMNLSLNMNEIVDYT
eukprot:XP_011682539.1 PREDICTED: uncharacterized protein LOC105446865 [Strongylocentrotus purpuratus]